MASFSHKEPSWDLNFLHKFEIPSFRLSGLYEKLRQMSVRLFGCFPQYQRHTLISNQKFLNEIPIGIAMATVNVSGFFISLCHLTRTDEDEGTYLTVTS